MITIKIEGNDRRFEASYGDETSWPDLAEGFFSGLQALGYSFYAYPGELAGAAWAAHEEGRKDN